MSTRLIIFTLLSAGVITLASCSGSEATDSRHTSADVNNDELIAKVDTVTVCSAPFKSDIVSNGRVQPAEFADIYFRSAELIEDVAVHNGQRVRRGQTLAKLDMFKLNAEKTKLEASLAQAKLELQDVLIGQGYNPDDLASVPQDVMALARIRSGLEQAEANYNTTIRDIENAVLTAPFDGVVANVKGAAHTMASAAEPFCRIINDSRMEVEFPVLESEMAHIRPGEAVEIIPYNGGETYRGHITEINPVVDENGHVDVKASIDDGRGLIAGINVRIRSSHSLGDRLVVPKSAVVLRTGRQVAFTYQDGKAMWNYVTTGLENLDSYEITEGLKEGDRVIFSGNENLAHETPVIIQSDKQQ